MDKPMVSRRCHPDVMDDARVGTVIRMARIRRRLRQSDLATGARVSRSTISRVERGHLGSLKVDVLRAIGRELDIRVDLEPRWRGGDLDRMLSARHSVLHESVARAFARDHHEWSMASEVSFAFGGERGIIDILLWHPGRRALLVIELKTTIVDVGEMLGTLDRKRRLAWRVARMRGWQPETVSAWIILMPSRTNERRIAEFRTMLRTAYPADGRSMRRWLREPVGTIAALSMWPASMLAGTRATAGPRRVRPP
jgi:transcriptional regulator with XRE-family HTH domain